MVIPDRRRAAGAAPGPVGVPQRRVCRVVGQHRSTQRRSPVVRAGGRTTSMGRGCATSPSPIPAGDGAKPTMSPPGKAWSSTRSGHGGCGAPTGSNGHRNGGTSVADWATAPLPSCAPSAQARVSAQAAAIVAGYAATTPSSAGEPRQPSWAVRRRADF